MPCIHCNSDKILELNADVTRLRGSYIHHIHRAVDILNFTGLGDRDKISFSLCLNCGRIQSFYPKNIPEDGKFARLDNILPELK
jgi:hypothetical protein